MKYDPLSRRLFLQGASGLTLTLPSLVSLLPKAAQAAEARPIRYVQVVNVYSPTASIFYGGLKPNQKPQSSVNVKKLSEVSGSLSPIFGAGFDALKNKITLMQGIDTQIQNPNHHSCFGTTASSYASGLDGDGNPPVAGNESIDVILSKSAKVYPSSVPAARKLASLNPTTGDGYSSNRTFSWQQGGSKLEMIRPVSVTQTFYDTFASSFGTGQGSTPTVDNRELDLMAAVYGDYKKVRDGQRISAADKQKLEAHLALIDDIQKGLKPVTVPGSGGGCVAPMRDAEGNIEAKITNQFKILAAAMACDLTRVANITLGMAAGYDARHDDHHSLFGKTNTPLITDLKTTANRVAKLLSIFDGVPDGDGTLLDNSIVYWVQQYGMVLSDSQHESSDMAVMVGGGAGGQLKQGHFIDYRNESSSARGRGLPMNNLLVTLMNCMGLGSSDYEKTAGQGYGYYNLGNFGVRPNASFWQGTSGRRSPLPFFYTGVARG